MKSQSFNVCIIGSGTSAYYAASVLGKAGKSIAMVDERGYGGTCSLRGCQPKKYLVANAEAVAMSKHLSGTGLDGVPVTNWTQLQALKNEFVAPHSADTVKGFQDHGVATFHGRATFASEDSVVVHANSAWKSEVSDEQMQKEDVTLTADHIILATGASPRVSKFPGAELCASSEDFLNLKELPQRILFIGGGYISFEFATVAAMSGAKPIILHRSDKPLKNFEQDMIEVLIAASKDNGVDLCLETEPTSIEKTATGSLLVKRTKGEPLEVDFVVEASGRVPNLSVVQEADGGAKGNVAFNPSRGITVNEYLQSTSNPRVYAIGDCAASGLQLAPVADEEGKTAAKNILEGNTKKIDYNAIPSAVFTIPPLATVGMDEEAAKKSGKNFRVNKGNTSGWPSSKRIGEKHGAYKVLIDNESNQILGAHLVRHNAAECINIFALAMKFKIPASELAEFMWAYPTYTSDCKYMVR